MLFRARQAVYNSKQFNIIDYYINNCYIKKVITNTRINNKLYSDCMSNNDSFR